MTNPIEDKWRDQAINEKVECLQKGNQTVSFSDDDVKRLKEDSESNKYNRRPSLETVKALLARMEAAEWLRLEVFSWMRMHGYVPNKSIRSADEAWRKAAGKDGV